MSGNDGTLFFVTHAILQHAAHSEAEATRPCLPIATETLERLSALTASQLAIVARCASRIIEFSIDQQRLDTIIAHAERETRQRAIEDELLRQNASMPMVADLLGWTNHHYTARRRALGLGTPGGRPRSTTPDEEEAIRIAWRETCGLQDAERFLKVGRTTGIPLNTIWNYLRPRPEPAEAC